MVAFKKATKNEGNIHGDKIDVDSVKYKYESYREFMCKAGELLNSWRNETVYGYGAGLQVPVLSYHLKNDLSINNLRLYLKHSDLAKEY